MKRYQIQPGDTLSKISKDKGVSMQHLIKTNNIKNPNVIRAYDYIYY